MVAGLHGCLAPLCGKKQQAVRRVATPPSHVRAALQGAQGSTKLSRFGWNVAKKRIAPRPSATEESKAKKGGHLPRSSQCGAEAQSSKRKMGRTLMGTGEDFRGVKARNLPTGASSNSRSASPRLRCRRPLVVPPGWPSDAGSSKTPNSSRLWRCRVC